MAAIVSQWFVALGQHCCFHPAPSPDTRDAALGLAWRGFARGWRLDGPFVAYVGGVWRRIVVAPRPGGVQRGVGSAQLREWCSDFPWSRGDWGWLLVADPARKYTDVDYIVFTDAAEEALKPGGSPYDRATYRYTPLLAWLMVPNVIVAMPLGKVLFSLADVWAGWLIRSVLVARGVSERYATVYACGWLFSPMAINISTRGSADCLVCALVLWAVDALVRRHTSTAALALGLAVHSKIYPAIFALPMALFIDDDYGDDDSNSRPRRRVAEWVMLPTPPPRTTATITDATASVHRLGSSESAVSPSRLAGRRFGSWLATLVTWRRVRFGLMSLVVFALATGAGYAVYGWRFLEDAYLYHLGRVDPRHNFSPYFYSLYLGYGQPDRQQLGLAAFVPQLAVVVVAGAALYKDLPLAVFVQAFAFVALNKVCTAQYFLWWQSILPIIMASTQLPSWAAAAMGAVWMGAQVHWLLWASQLEESGASVFFEVWVAGVIFLAVNAFVLAAVVLATPPRPVFASGPGVLPRRLWARGLARWAARRLAWLDDPSDTEPDDDHDDDDHEEDRCGACRRVKAD